MKTVLKQNGRYERMEDDAAKSEVSFRGGKYVSKLEWKQNSRDVRVVEQSPEVLEKNNKAKSKKIEKRLKLKSKQR